VLADVPLTAPAYAEEIFGPVAPVVAFSSAEEAVRLAADTEYGLSLGILTRDVMKGLALADQIPIGLVHINDQTVNDEAVIPFGGVSESGNGARAGGMQANLDAYAQWAKTHNSLLIVNFDEDNSLSLNHIYTTFVGAGVRTGTYSEKITHYTVLRTIESAYGLSALGGAASVSPITDVWS